LVNHRYDNTTFENNLIIYIDFRKFFEVHESFQPNRIAKEVLESIYAKYEDLELHKLSVLIRIYRIEIKRKDENIWAWDKQHNEENYQSKLAAFLEDAQKDPLDHLTYLSHYLIRERRKRLIIIIDNADQFSDEIQEKLFIFSHSLTKSTYCGTIISLREGYYRKWQNSPPFDAYESNIYHITAPRYVEILQKRIQYAIDKVKNNQQTYSVKVTTGRETSLSPSYIEYFLKGLQDSLFAIGNSALLDFVNQTTFPNIREGLRVLKVFLHSGHTKVSEYIKREQERESNVEKSRQIIPLHEFIKSIALQNRHYYSSEISIVYNLFTPPIDSDDHFIKLYILHELGEILDSIAFTEKFVKKTILIDKLTSFGYRINVVNSALSSLLKASLIDTDEQLSDVEWNELPTTYNLNITSKGFYYLKEIIERFHYYDLIGQDTPIYDTQYYNSLDSIFPTSSTEGSRNFELRKDHVKLFIDYLVKMEDKQPTQIKAVYNNLMLNIKSKVLEEIQRMENKA
jgi:hypothetical protein